MKSILLMILLAVLQIRSASTLGPYYQSLEAGTGVTGAGGSSIPATSSAFYRPFQMYYSSAGGINGLLVAELQNNRVRKISDSGIVTNFAGDVSLSSSVEGLPATSTYINGPRGVCVDSNGNAYIASYLGSKIFKVTANNYLTTTNIGTGAASATSAGLNGDNGPASSATLNQPYFVYINSASVLYIADSANYKIRSISVSGIISTVAGNGQFAATYFPNTPATQSTLANPTGIYCDSSGKLYIAEQAAYLIKVVSAAGIISQFAGGGSSTSNGAPATSSQLTDPTGVFADLAGNVFITDYSNHRVRAIDTNGIMSTIIGTGNTVSGLTLSAMGTSTAISYPCGIFVDTSGFLHVSDNEVANGGAAVVRRAYSLAPTMAPSNLPSVLPSVAPSFSPTVYTPISTYYQTLEVGTGVATSGADYIAATSSGLKLPYQVFHSSASGINGLLVADCGNNRIRRIDSNGIVSKFVGSSSTAATGNGLAATSFYLQPLGVCVDSAEAVYVSDSNAHKVYRFSASGYLSSTFAGTGASSAGATALNGDNGQATSAIVGTPYILHAQASVLYVGDYNQHRIRAIGSDGIVTTVAGTGVSSTSAAIGPATRASLYGPSGVYCDTAGKIYIAEESGLFVKVVSASGIISVLAGTGASGLDGGSASSARIGQVVGVFGDSLGRIYFCDYGNKLVRAVDTNGIISTIYGTGSDATTLGASGFAAMSTPITQPLGIHLDSSGYMHVSDLSSAGAGTSIVRRLYSLSPTVQPSLVPTLLPTVVPTVGPTVGPSAIPSLVPSICPSIFPSIAPSVSPSINPSLYPTMSPSCLPTALPSVAPTLSPSQLPSFIPTLVPTLLPTVVPSLYPTVLPSICPTISPSCCPTVVPSVVPTLLPSINPSLLPSTMPSLSPTVSPSGSPSVAPTVSPSLLPTLTPTFSPSVLPTIPPSQQPTVSPSVLPSFPPTQVPSLSPTIAPSLTPSVGPSTSPSCNPSPLPSTFPTTNPSACPSMLPSVIPSTVDPSVIPSKMPSLPPTQEPSVAPTNDPSVYPSTVPSALPSTLATSINPSTVPSVLPTHVPSVVPSISPSIEPSIYPSVSPITLPTTNVPSNSPSHLPSCFPSCWPTVNPSYTATASPSVLPTDGPSSGPSLMPSLLPSEQPSKVPSIFPTELSFVSTSTYPSVVPSSQPSPLPSCTPTLVLSSEPTPVSSLLTSNVQSLLPTCSPSIVPSEAPSNFPTIFPSYLPSLSPSVAPSDVPCLIPSMVPSLRPSLVPSVEPTTGPSAFSTEMPTAHTILPTAQPSIVPSVSKSQLLSISPSSIYPTLVPSMCPTLKPSTAPTTLAPILSPLPTAPTVKPSRIPSVAPSVKPSRVPSVAPSRRPTAVPSVRPSMKPTSPTASPTLTSYPSVSTEPTVAPTVASTMAPSVLPSVALTGFPTIQPSESPTPLPTTATPTTVSPSAAPSTIESYNFQPKATLPINQSISVTGARDFNFKIILPFLVMSAGPYGNVFSDVVLIPDTSVISYVVKGVKPGSSSVVNAIGYSGAGGFDTSKRSVAVLKDINGDGISDLIIGDPYLSRCYVLFGTTKGLVEMTQGFTIFGESDGDMTGWSVSSAGDVNNDTFSDIIIGAPNAYGVGAFYVVYGRSSKHVDVYLNNLTLIQGFSMYGTHKSDFLGISVSNTGDVNGDGCDDIIAGAVMTSQYFTGAAYVVYGKSQFGFKAVGVSYSYSGYSVSAAGDVNGDGLNDILIGSEPQRSSLSPTAYVIFGSKSVSGDVSLISMSSSQGIRITGGGMTVSYAGDVNHDGLDDLMIGGNLNGNALGGSIVFMNISHMIRLTSQPSVLPTSLPVFAPTLTPTRVPSRSPVSPSVCPSRTPSMAPSLVPSVQPIFGLNDPTSYPTSEPSVPTVSPSQVPSEPPTVTPSEQPSESPTVMASEVPSDFPTVSPSLRPSVVPSVIPSLSPSTLSPTSVLLTRVPFAAPTLLPSVLPNVTVITSYYITRETILVNQSMGHQQYIVNTSENVWIENPIGYNRYFVFPYPASRLTITYLNCSNDVIDLTSFTFITAFNQLVITEGSVIVNLPNEQVIHILNLHPDDVSASNFVFYQDALSENHHSKTTKVLSVVAGCLIAIGGVILGLLLCLRLSDRLWCFRKSSLLKPVDRFLVTITEVTDEGSDVESLVHSAFALSQSTNLSDYTLQSQLQNENSENSIPLSEHTINSEGVWVNRHNSIDSWDELSMRRTAIPANNYTTYLNQERLSSIYPYGNSYAYNYETQCTFVNQNSYAGGHETQFFDGQFDDHSRFEWNNHQRNEVINEYEDNGFVDNYEM